MNGFEIYTFMQNYLFTYDEMKDDISSKFLCLILDISTRKKTYLTTSENFHKRLFAIFHTKEMRNLFTNSRSFQQKIQQMIK